jgi:hypothetical protein
MSSLELERCEASSAARPGLRLRPPDVHGTSTGRRAYALTISARDTPIHQPVLPVRTAAESHAPCQISSDIPRGELSARQHGLIEGGGRQPIHRGIAREDSNLLYGSNAPCEWPQAIRGGEAPCVAGERHVAPGLAVHKQTFRQSWRDADPRQRGQRSKRGAAARRPDEAGHLGGG